MKQSNLFSHVESEELQAEFRKKYKLKKTAPLVFFRVINGSYKDIIIGFFYKKQLFLNPKLGIFLARVPVNLLNISEYETQELFKGFKEYLLPELTSSQE